METELTLSIVPPLWMQKFGEIEDCRDQDANTVVMTFKTRNEAENVRCFTQVSTGFRCMDMRNFGLFLFQAANLGAKFKGRVLQISWFKPKTTSVTTEPEDDEAKDEENRVQQQFLTKDHLSTQKAGRELTV